MLGSPSGDRPHGQLVFEEWTWQQLGHLIVEDDFIVGLSVDPARQHRLTQALRAHAEALLGPLRFDARAARVEHQDD